MPRVTVRTASALGAAHRAKNIGNEDAVGWRTDARGTVLGVADGHSDPRCVRADRGARFAVQAAVDLLDPDARTAAQDLADAWDLLVAADARRDPLGPNAGPVRLAYGTTLIACWISDTALRLLQIGDGVAIVATGAGASRPIPPDEHEGSPETESLASDAAATRARTARVPLTDLPVVVCLSTDGVDAAYPDGGGLLSAVEELRSLAIREGASSVAELLEPWVREAAAVSGDDATVAVAIVTGADDGRGR
jgi:serine/threonine protein phosphatase PrpC